jgi:hypothetical protein
MTTETALSQIASLDWFVTTLTQIRAGDWMAQALTTGNHPLVGYRCAASGATIDLALTNLLAKLENSFDLVPPPEPLTTNSSAPNLLGLLGLASKPASEPRITRRI